jgi:hypothetical protein
MKKYQRIEQITFLRTLVQTITVKIFECFGYVCIVVCIVVLSRLRFLFKASCQLRRTLVFIGVVMTK